MSEEVGFLFADKHQSLLQVDAILFNRFSQTCPKYPGKFVISLWYVKKEIRSILIFDLCVDLVMGIILICQSKFIAND